MLSSRLDVVSDSAFLLAETVVDCVILGVALLGWGTIRIIQQRVIPAEF
jgi:hypothetical protein